MGFCEALRVLRGEGEMPGGVRCYLAQCTLEGGAGAPAPACEGARALSAAVRRAWACGAWPPPAVAAAAAGGCGVGAPLVFSQANLWACDTVGVALTGTHFDAHPNVLLVLRGEKRVLAAPFSARARLRAAPLFAATPNHAEADLFERASVGGGGGVAGARPAPEQPPPALDALLRAGDALFLPEGWWHSVLSSAGAVGVNFWFSRAGGGGGGDLEYEARLALLALGRARVAGARAELLARAAEKAAGGEGGGDLAALLRGGGGGAAAKRPREEGGGGAPPRRAAAATAAAEDALLGAAAGEGGGGRALRMLLALLEGEGGSELLQGLFDSLSAEALDALQHVWEREEEEEEGVGAGGRGDVQNRGASFQRRWGEAFGGGAGGGAAEAGGGGPQRARAGEAAAQRLAGAREEVMKRCLEAACAGLI